MQPLRLIRPERPDEFYTGERCHITELLNHATLPELSLARARVEPGVTTALHRLAGREIYIILSGRGWMDCGDGEGFAVGPGDAVDIPAGTPQRIRNDGTDDLVFLCLCTPRFRPEDYADLERAGTG